MYMVIHICIDACMHKDDWKFTVQVYLYACIWLRIRVCNLICTYMYLCVAFMYVLLYACIWLRNHVCVDIIIDMYVDICIHMYVDICIHIYVWKETVQVYLYASKRPVWSF